MPLISTAILLMHGLINNWIHISDRNLTRVGEGVRKIFQLNKALSDDRESKAIFDLSGFLIMRKFPQVENLNKRWGETNRFRRKKKVFGTLKRDEFSPKIYYSFFFYVLLFSKIVPHLKFCPKFFQEFLQLNFSEDEAILAGFQLWPAL